MAGGPISTLDDLEIGDGSIRVLLDLGSHDGEEGDLNRACAWRNVQSQEPSRVDARAPVYLGPSADENSPPTPYHHAPETPELKVPTELCSKVADHWTKQSNGDVQDRGN